MRFLPCSPRGAYFPLAAGRAAAGGAAHPFGGATAAASSEGLRAGALADLVLLRAPTGDMAPLALVRCCTKALTASSGASCILEAGDPDAAAALRCAAAGAAAQRLSIKAGANTRIIRWRGVATGVDMRVMVSPEVTLRAI